MRIMMFLAALLVSLPAAAQPSPEPRTDDSSQPLSIRAMPRVVSSENGRLPKPVATGGTPPYRITRYVIDGVPIEPGHNFRETPDHPAIRTIAERLGEAGRFNPRGRGFIDADFERRAGRPPRSLVLPIQLSATVRDSKGQTASVNRHGVWLEMGESGGAFVRQIAEPTQRARDRKRAEERAAAQARREAEDRAYRQSERQRTTKMAAERREAREAEALAREMERQRETADRLKEQQADAVAIAVAPPSRNEMLMAGLYTILFGLPIILGPMLAATAIVQRISQRPSDTEPTFTTLAKPVLIAAAAATLLACAASIVRTGGCLATVALFGMNDVDTVVRGGQITAAVYLVVVISLSMLATAKGRSASQTLSQIALVCVSVVPLFVYFRFFDWR